MEKFKKIPQLSRAEKRKSKLSKNLFESFSTGFIMYMINPVIAGIVLMLLIILSLSMMDNDNKIKKISLRTATYLLGAVLLVVVTAIKIKFGF
jgi:fumarate reductase subunit D